MAILIVTADRSPGERVARMAADGGHESRILPWAAQLPQDPPPAFVIAVGLTVEAVSSLRAAMRAGAGWERSLLLAIAPAGVPLAALLDGGADDCLACNFADAELALRLRVFTRRLVSERRTHQQVGERAMRFAAIVESSADAIITCDDPVDGRMLPSRAEAAPEDISERKQAEAALRRAEDYLREIVEAAPVIIFAIDREGIYTHYSGALRPNAGGTPLGQSLFDVRRDYSEITAAARRALAGESFTYVTELDGITWETHYSVATNDAGEIVGATGVATDVTSRVHAEAETRQSEANLRAIFDSTTDGILLLDSGGFLVARNPACERLHQATFGGPLPVGSRMADFLPGSGKKVLAERLARCLAGETFSTESSYTDTSGNAVTWEMTYNPILAATGEVSGVVILTHDITGRRRMEAEARQSAANLRAIFEATEDCIVLLDSSGNIVTFNEAMARRQRAHYGKALGAMEAGRPLDGYLPVEGPKWFRERLARCLSGETFVVESNYRSELDSELIFEDTYYPVAAGSGEASGVAIVSHDVTNRRRTEAALFQAQKMESLGVLAGGIAHDFNNLLVAILGNAGLALTELPATSPARETVREIEIAGQRAAELALQMLAYSGKGRFVIEALNLNTLVGELAQLLRVSIGKGVQVAYNFTPELLLIEADATQVRQVVMNLVINASDAIGGREGTISITTGVVYATSADLAESWLAPDLPEGEYAYLDVADTGSGMDAETVKRIFDPFFTTKFTGRGLGLAAVLGIVRGHNGALKVASEPGSGTTFRLLLPRQAAPAAPIARPAPRTAQWRGSGVILIADDEKTVRQVTARALGLFGFQTAEAVDGQAAVEYLAAHGEEVVCVLLDMTMPRMNGAEASAQIALSHPQLPVIVMSGYSELDAAKGFAPGQVAAFIQKPYELKLLRETLQRVLERPE